MLKHRSLLLLATLAASSCGDDAKRVDLSQRQAVEPDTNPDERPIRIAIGSMITPKAGFVYYHELLVYLESKLGRQVQLVDRSSYTEVNSLLETGAVDVAFVCGGPYVEGHDRFGLELLVAPQSHGGTVYYSYIITAAESPARSFEDLRGKRFAFTDPDSNSGAIVPKFMLMEMGETAESFFESFTYTYAHDKSIQAVAQGVVDAAAVDHLVWEYMNHNSSELAHKTRILTRSPPYGIPPVVASPKLDATLKTAIRAELLRVHEDPLGWAILQGMLIDRFVPIEDGAYESIRIMFERLSELETKAPDGK